MTTLLHRSKSCRWSKMPMLVPKAGDVLLCRYLHLTRMRRLAAWRDVAPFWLALSPSPLRRGLLHGCQSLFLAPWVLLCALELVEPVLDSVAESSSKARSKRCAVDIMTI